MTHQSQQLLCAALCCQSKMLTLWISTTLVILLIVSPYKYTAAATSNKDGKSQYYLLCKIVFYFATFVQVVNSLFYCRPI